RAGLGRGRRLAPAAAPLGAPLPRHAERAALLRRPPAGAPGADRDRARGITLRESLTERRQWALNLSWLLIGGIAIMLSVHAVPFARDQGVSLTGASLSLTAYGIGSAIGRLLGGTLSDRLGARRTIAAAFVLQIASLVTLLSVPSRAALLLSL